MLGISLMPISHAFFTTPAKAYPDDWNFWEFEYNTSGGQDFYKVYTIHSDDSTSDSPRRALRTTYNGNVNFNFIDFDPIENILYTRVTDGGVTKTHIYDLDYGANGTICNAVGGDTSPSSGRCHVPRHKGIYKTDDGDFVVGSVTASTRINLTELT